MKHIKKYIFLIVMLFSASLVTTSCGFTIIPESDFEVDNTSPYITSITGKEGQRFDLKRKTNSSFEEIFKTSETQIINYNIPVDAEIQITFSEDMYPDSLFQYGVSETVVVIEGEPSRSFLNGMKSPPLSDTNINKILKTKVQLLTTTNKKTLLMDFSNAENCLTEDDFKTKFCKLKKNTNYTLVVSQGVLNENGRELVVQTDEGKYIEDNFVLLFRTAGDAPTVVSTQPSNGETGICLNLQEVRVDFSTDMDLNSINTNTIFITGGSEKTETVIKEKKNRYAILALNAEKQLKENTSYKINLTEEIQSQSRASLEEVSFTFTTAANASTTGPAFVQNPSGVISGTSVEISWSTDVKSLADIKYGKGLTPSTPYAYSAYATDHSVTIELTDGPGDYTVSVQPKDRCGNISDAKTTSGTILNHPLISEVSPNADSSSNEFIELYNAGETTINLSSYSLFVGADEFPLANQDLPKGYYFVLADNTDTTLIIPDVNTVITLQDIDMTKSEDVFLKFNGVNVDTYTYDFKASGSSNFSAQRIDVNLRDSDGTNYCENTPTPGSVNSCE